MIILKKSAVFTLLFAGLLCLVNNRHSYNPEFTWRSNLWADPAGYYVYLPALFIYDFDANRLPKEIDKFCGEGFRIDKENNKVFTKYTSGVAILQLPFFLVAHAVEYSNHSAYKGFSGLYQKVPDMAAAFYCVIALIFLYSFLRYYYDMRLTLIVCGCMFLGTTIYFYTVYGNGNSHVYSFALFAALLYLTKTITDSQEPKLSHIIYWSFVIAFILLIRPLNLLFIIPVVFIDCGSFKEAWERIKFFSKPKFIAIIITAGFITFLPQFIYWKYLSGNWIYYSYQNETFTYWKSPQFARLLFSPNNGLLPYNPIYIFIVYALLAMCFTKAKNGFNILLCLCALTYFSASWHDVEFGCGYSARNYSEYTALFALPLGWLFQQIRINAISKYLIGIFVFASVIINQKAIYSYDRCFWGNDWDYEEYFQFFTRGGYTNKFVLKDGGEFIPEKQYSETFTVHANKHTISNFRLAKIAANVKLTKQTTEAMLVIETKDSNDSIIDWKAINLKDFTTVIDTFHTVRLYSPLPFRFNTDAHYNIAVWNPKKENFFVKDIKLVLR